MTGQVTVVLIKNSTVDEVFLYIGDRDSIAKRANEKFIDLCRVHVEDWEKYTPDEIEGMLDDGYYDFGDNSVCISWPTVNDNEDIDVEQ